MRIKLPKIVVALLVQGVVFLFIALAVSIAPRFIEPPYAYEWLVFLQSLLAALLSSWVGLPVWWRWIQFLIPIGLYLGLLSGFNSWWALALFIVFALVFANAFQERVPLYLTNATTKMALKTLIKDKSKLSFMDLGCGLGGNVVFMAKQSQVIQAHGVETAPVPLILAKLYSVFKGGQVFAKNIWRTDLSHYDVVYAFLSPEPMPRLWQKVSQEMPVGSVLVSNSFAVPDIEPSEVWALNDRRQTHLYIYYITESHR